ncbi:MAG: DUF1810 domain-containing protein [Oscillospiraceae bacterium]|nr:DUF1810 domain-containing protein [Oscillospiraceae bacterium]
MCYDLSRFIEGQQLDYPRALAEMKNGRKTSHWIWYIFPQMRGLGRSSMSEYYGIQDLGEAKAYLADPILGPRLIEICNVLLSLDTDDARAVMGRPDDMKLKSSMTLFDEATESTDVFRRVLEKFFRGRKDNRTLQMLGIPSEYSKKQMSL